MIEDGKRRAIANAQEAGRVPQSLRPVIQPIDPFAEQSNERPGVTLPERGMRKSLGTPA
jgi:hypothetical protein